MIHEDVELARIGGEQVSPSRWWKLVAGAYAVDALEVFSGVGAAHELVFGV